VARGNAGDAPVVDEDTLVVPSAWKRAVFPRRGGWPAPAVVADDAAVTKARELLAAAEGSVKGVLNAPQSDRELVEHAEAAWRSQADATPLGAAALAAVGSHVVGWNRVQDVSAFADGWVASRGVLFAVEAVLELSGVGVYFRGGVSTGHIYRPPATDAWGYFSHFLAVAGRVRAHLAAAPDEVYEHARALAAGYRDRGPRERAAACFLLPTETAWVDADCRAQVQQADSSIATALWYSVSSCEQAEHVRGQLSYWYVPSQLGMLVTAIDGVGPELAPTLLDTFYGEHTDAEGKQRLLSVLACLPTDEAFGLLTDRLDQKYVQPAAMEAAKRFPARALRVLCDAALKGTSAGRVAREMLRAHVLANPELVEAESPGLSSRANELIAAIIAEATAYPSATADALPAVLVAPPWTEKRRSAAPVVVAGMSRVDAAEIAWRPGEQQEWLAASRWTAHWRVNKPWAEVAANLTRMGAHEQIAFFVNGPEELVAPLVVDWGPGYMWDAEHWMRVVIGRFGLLALKPALRAAAENPASRAGLLMPFACAPVADLMADWLARLKSVRPVALAWLARHPGVAAQALIPAALAKPGAARRAAEGALRAVAAAGHADVVRAAAGRYDEQVIAGVEALLATDPLHLLPARMPTVPDWADPNLLPPVLLRDRTAALPADAARHLCTMLTISKPGEEYAGLPIVKQACDPTSLAEFGWTLFLRWQAVGAPSKESWAFEALRWLGDDETVRRLSPLIRAWPGEGGHARAVAGLDILASIGSDVALMHLYGISQKVKFKGLKDRAGLKIAEVAADLGLSADQLGDRLVPDLGLDAKGSMVLDYGPRSFTVGFDEQLKPYVLENGAGRRKALPKPGVRDDEDLAAAAYQRFSGLKKDVRTIAADQIARLEQAMVTQRRWTGAEFRELFVAHPLLWHIVRRLVWASFADDQVQTAFRVAEDRSLADVSDEQLSLADDAAVGIAHPLHLGGTVPQWSEVFADYEILQPFAQLGRATYVLTEEERKAPSLSRVTNIKVPTGKVLGLERRGWRRGAAQDGGVQGWIERAIPGGRSIVAGLDPGIPVGMVNEWPEQQITEVWVNDRPGGEWRRQGNLGLGDLDEVTASELLRDLTEVIGG
jgi:hypothetical protein